MVRPLRINVKGSWHHVTARGQNRKPIYYDDADRQNFLKRVGEMTSRFGLEVHAYVLMPNHYHLLVRVPEANLSQALQWLNAGYAMWWNRRHDQVGYVFQGRYKAVLVEAGEWILTLSRYLHFNPVAVERLGWGKAEKKAESLGIRKVTPELRKARLDVLRNYRWSSYRAYAGYEAPPVWLSMAEVLKQIRGGRAGYRKQMELRLTNGQQEKVWAQMKWGIVLGGDSFAEEMRAVAVPSRETGSVWKPSRTRWEQIIRAVEQIKLESWQIIMDRHGDWGRDLVFWLASRHAGMTMCEIGKRMGKMDYSAVGAAIYRFERNAPGNPDVQRAIKKTLDILGLKAGESLKS